MPYERPAIERRVPITALLGDTPISPGAGDALPQPIWRRGETRKD
jgi:hypothetical protein